MWYAQYLIKEALSKLAGPLRYSIGGKRPFVPTYPGTETPMSQAQAREELDSTRAYGGFQRKARVRESMYAPVLAKLKSQAREYKFRTAVRPWMERNIPTFLPYLGDSRSLMQLYDEGVAGPLYRTPAAAAIRARFPAVSGMADTLDHGISNLLRVPARLNPFNKPSGYGWSQEGEGPRVATSPLTHLQDFQTYLKSTGRYD